MDIKDTELKFNNELKELTNRLIMNISRIKEVYDDTDLTATYQRIAEEFFDDDYENRLKLDNFWKEDQTNINEKYKKQYLDIEYDYDYDAITLYKRYNKKYYKTPNDIEKDYKTKTAQTYKYFKDNTSTSKYIEILNS